MHYIFKTLNIILILGLVAVAAFTAYITFPQFGNQALIVRSGSMTPTIGVGDIVAVTKAHDYRIGDVIAFKSEKNSDTIITHRITDIEHAENALQYKTKGDANEEEDNWIVTQDRVLGKLFITVPSAGKILAFAKSDIGFPVLIIAPAIFVILLETISIIREIRKNRRKKDEEAPYISESPFGFAIHDRSKWHNLQGLRAIIVLLLATTLTLPSTIANFQDTEQSTENIFQASANFDEEDETQEPPTEPEETVVINEIMWMGAHEDSLDEWIELRNLTGSAVDLSGWDIVGLGSGATAITIPDGESIPANGFYLISNSLMADSILNIEPDHQTGSVSLLNNGEQLILRDSFDNPIDTANIAGAWLAGLDTQPYRSMERKDPPGDGTIGDNWRNSISQINLDFAELESEYATPKAQNSL